MTRSPYRVPVVGLGVVAAVGAFVIGFLAVQDPATVLPMTLELVVLTGITWIGIQRVRERGLRGWLVRLTLAAVGARLVVLFAVHFVFAEEFFAPDVLTYRAQGRSLAEYWRAGGLAPDLELGTQVVYPYLNGFFHYVLGSSTFGMVVLNVFAGVWTVLLTFAIGRELLEERTAKLAASLVAFFPSLILWSVLNIRDALTTFVAVTTLYFGLRLYQAVHLRTFVGVVVGVLALVGLRDYMGFLMVAGLILGAFAVLRPGRVGVSLAAGTVLTLMLVFAIERLGLFQRVVVESPLDQLDQLRRGLQQGAGSAFGTGYDTTTIEGALRYLPLGVAFFLFAPFPWAVESTLQVMALPEVMLWYVLVPFTLVGLMTAPEKTTSPAWVVVLAVLMVTVGSYALVEGNFGTAYRHRAQVMPFLFLFSAAGIERVWDWWQAEQMRRGYRRASQRLPLRATSDPSRTGGDGGT